MKVPITFQEGKRKVKSFGEPEFLLFEVSSAKKIPRLGSGLMELLM